MKWRLLSKILRTLFVFLIIFLFLTTQSNGNVNSRMEQVRSYSRPVEFDFWNWTFEALWHKFSQMALNFPAYIDEDTEKELVIQAAQLTGQIQYLEWQIIEIYTNPEIKDPQTESRPFEEELLQKKELANLLLPLGESILQRQISQILHEKQLSVAGQVLPPVFFEASPLPKALIVSPREVIRQDVNLSLLPGLTLEEVIEMEDAIANAYDVSTLITNIGGIGTYPTMISQTSDLTWLIGVVCHEWTHNFLTLRPLGMNYGTNNELRTMNETTASIAEEELKWAVIQRFYPERMPPPQEEPIQQPTEENPEPVFNFDYEMYVTRTRVDLLLADGKISEAESYMEERRQFFYNNGYNIRKLNQAWFAFHSAYVNAPSTGEEGQTGAAGSDPVGPAVWLLREQNSSLADFLHSISWMTSFAALTSAVQNGP